MVKVITQQTFNDVVKENMEEFDMSMAEAVQEAVQQFEAQGVDLSNIVVGADLGLSSEPIIQCVHRLQQNTYEGNTERLCGDLKFFQEECSKELAKKILAGKEGAYDGLLKLLEGYKDNKQVEVLIFQALIALMTGYPDLLDERGIKTIASVITMSRDMDVIKNALKWCRECCIKHENNRQAIFDSYIIKRFGPLLETPAVKEVCGVVRSLCLDDDIRVQVSKAHEHARSLAVDLLCPLTSLLNKYKSQKEELAEILLTMSALMVRHEFCAKVDDANGLDLISDIISEYNNDEKINRTCFNLLKTLAGNDDVKAHVFQKITLVTLVIHSIERHKGKPACAAAGLGLLAALALRSPSNSQVMCELNAPEIIIGAMKIHSTDSNTQRRGCWAIRNIVSRRKDLSSEFIKLGVEELLTNIIKNHKDCHDDAKAALRDLGCDVKLIERWTGKGTSLTN